MGAALTQSANYKPHILIQPSDIVDKIAHFDFGDLFQRLLSVFSFKPDSELIEDINAALWEYNVNEIGKRYGIPNLSHRPFAIIDSGGRGKQIMGYGAEIGLTITGDFNPDYVDKLNEFANNILGAKIKDRPQIIILPEDVAPYFSKF
jgi:hypothetical protein